MEEKYKDWTIRYNENNNIFVAEKHITKDEKIELKDKELSILRKKCDAYDKKSLGFKRAPCYDNNFREAEITSVAQKGWDDDVIVWTSRKKEKGEWSSGREKVSLKRLYRATKENEERINKIKRLREEADEIEGLLDKFDAKEFEKFLGG